MGKSNNKINLYNFGRVIILKEVLNRSGQIIYIKKEKAV